MADSTLLALFQELMEAYDSSIDTSDGAAFRTAVLDPFLTRIGDSVLDVDLESFMVARLKEEYPDMDVSRYSGIRDLAVRSMVTMIEPVRREIKAIKNSQSLDNYDTMTREELQALLANYFITMDEGSTASGLVRVYFSSPQTWVATSLTEFSTGEGLKFYPTTTQTTTSTAMSFQQEDGLYYAEVSIQAEEAGDDYNVDAEDISKVSGVSGVIRVSNPDAFTSGVAQETKEEAVARAKESITTRTLSTSRGIKFLIKESFEFADTIQVIGYRDPEMDRDVLSGPVTISGVPDRYLVGEEDPDLSAGESIHIGGKTDVFVYQQDLVEDTLDIENLTDVGLRVMAGTSGFTEQDSSGEVSVLRDLHGNFAKNGVVAGDYLRLTAETGVVKADLLAVTSVSGTSLEVDGPITSAMSSVTYEIVRFDEDEEYLYVPLYDLVAVDSDGNAVTDDDSNYVQAIPGDADLGALLDGSDYVVKEENIASANALLPLVWVKSVVLLDPLTLLPDETEDPFPCAEVLLVNNLEAFTNGDGSTAASGTLRVYFRDALSTYLPPAARFTRGSKRYRPTPISSGTAQIIGETLYLNTDLTETVLKGYRIRHRGAVYTVVEDPTYDSGPDRTTLVVREDLTGLDGAAATFSIYPGVLQSEMAQDSDSLLYYADFDVVSTSVGADGNLDAETTLVAEGVVAEGWKLRSLTPVESLSTRDKPYLAFTRWVNDTIDLRSESDAWPVRVTYMSASSLVDVQDFVDDEDNRVVAEDLLVRHFLPALVRGAFTVDEDLDTEAGVDALTSYINELDPTENLEVSDLTKVLQEEGATYVKMPVTLVIYQQQQDRSWRATIVQDRAAFSRVSHFIVDEDFLTVESE